MGKKEKRSEKKGGKGRKKETAGGISACFIFLICSSHSWARAVAGRGLMVSVDFCEGCLEG